MYVSAEKMFRMIKRIQKLVCRAGLHRWRKCDEVAFSANHCIYCDDHVSTEPERSTNQHFGVIRGDVYFGDKRIGNYNYIKR